jgi:Fuc2NAc and GlcNAc transferase
MTALEAGIVVATLLFALTLTRVVQRIALARGVLDVPNQRSSHRVPTPRGGGIAIVITTATAWLGFAWAGILQGDIAIALLGGGLLVALIGLLDDRFQLSARLRLSVHFVAALWVLGWLHGLPPVLVADHLIFIGWAGYALGALGIVWLLNLFNFMDGIDGVAASEAIFVVAAGVLLIWFDSADIGVLAAALAFVAACLGFLWWNWPPAKIFMGDAGSGFLGFTIAVFALVDAREHSAALLVWLILGGVFFVDATVTLLRRLLRGERFYEAHRTHAYQWLTRRWGSHRRVTLAIVAVNVVWLLPLAWWARSRPPDADVIAVLALAPLVIIALIAGAGRSETALPRVSSPGAP